MSEDLEWQPVRLVFVPPHNDSAWNIEHQKKIAGMIVRVRREKTGALELMIMKGYGCDSEFLYEVHPEDVPKVFDDRTTARFCEHEILAD